MNAEKDILQEILENMTTFPVPERREASHKTAGAMIILQQLHDKAISREEAIANGLSYEIVDEFTSWEESWQVKFLAEVDLLLSRVYYSLAKDGLGVE